MQLTVTPLTFACVVAAALVTVILFRRLRNLHIKPSTPLPPEPDVMVGNKAMSRTDFDMYCRLMISFGEGYVRYRIMQQGYDMQDFEAAVERIYKVTPLSG